MKILFYEIKNSELEFFKENLNEDFESYFFKLPLNEKTYVDEKFSDAEAICTFVASKLTSDILKQFKNLKYIFLRSTGFSNVDLGYCKKKNIKLFNVPNYGSNTVAEYAFSLLLTLAKKITPAKNSLQNGEIDHSLLTGIELYSKTLGVIGVGNIGKKIIEISKGFSMNTICYDIERNYPYHYVSLDELYQNSDVIMISTPLTPKTKGMIDKTAISKMKKSAILVNVSRGEIVNTKDLTIALKENRISGAALDVIECEEVLCELWDFCLNTDMRQNCLKKYLFIQQLLKMQNVIITPHNAYNTIEAEGRILKTTIENILKQDTKNLIMI